MNINDLVMNQLSGAMLPQISQRIGADEGATANAIAAAVPLLLGAMARNASTPEGAASLHGALARDHDGSILDNLGGILGGLGGASNGGLGGGLGGALAGSLGTAILGHVLGGRRGTVETGLAQGTGLSASSAGALLEILAPIVLGAVGRAQQQNALNPSDLAGYIGGQSQAAAQQGGLMGMVSNLLDQNDDGSVMDDISRMAGNYFNKPN